MQTMKLKIGDRELPARVETILPSNPAAERGAPERGQEIKARSREPEQRPEADKAWSLRRPSH